MTRTNGEGAARKSACETLGRVLVLGLGKSGKSVVRYCSGLLGSRVDELFVAAGAPNEDAIDFARTYEGEGVRFEFGGDALDALGEGVPVGQEAGRPLFDLCIASPGIPFWSKLYQQALALSGEVISEVELAWRESRPDSTWVAITGTNGKTTTTACCAHVLRECGYAARAVGNIGDVCLDAVAAGDTQVYVAEVSSYQLHSCPRFAPDVAVVLNITLDHLHWHETFEAYAEAKFKLLDNLACVRETGGLTHGQSSAFSQSSVDGPHVKPPVPLTHALAILDATNDVVRAKVREMKAQDDGERGFDYVPLGTADGMRGDMRMRCGAKNAAFLDGDRFHVALGGADHLFGSVSGLQIEGEHNAGNALAAAAVAVALGVPDEGVGQALASFAPLEHRIEPCGQVNGVSCYNDSKATNVDATVKALASFPEKRVIVLLGGDDKGTDLADLVSAVHEHTAAAVCFGAAGDRFAQALRGKGDAPAPCDFECMVAAHMESALDAALAWAHTGDVVLLSPACASFDEFSSFEERGRVFKQLVAKRA